MLPLRAAALSVVFLLPVMAAAQSATKPAPAGPIDPRSMAGADIGAQVDAAIAALPAGGGTVRIPAGDYTFATTIKITHPGQHLVCDAGATLHYTGAGDAILVDPAAGAALDIDIDGEGGCHLLGTPAAQSGIHLRPGNTLAINGMRISGFGKGNGIELTGANSVQISRCAIYLNRHGIDMTTVRGYAPNAVHVSDNDISSNDWGVYSWNAHVVASRALANVYRDNVLESNRIGDMFLGWDAHTLVEGNYFESRGVAVSVGNGVDWVYDIHVSRNYFTVAGAGGYRSEVEIGNGSGVYIEGNYEDGLPGPIEGAGTGCAVNIVPGIRGTANNIFLRNAFSRVSEAKMSAHEFCYEGKTEIPPGVLGTWRIAGDVSIQGAVQAKGARLSGPVQLDQGAIGSTAESVHPGQACTGEGTLLIARPPKQPAQLYFCTAAHWQPVTPPK